MTMTATFGEFLHPAADHVSAAAGAGGELPDGAVCGVVRQLDRLVMTLARYLGDLTLPDEFDPAGGRRSSPEQLAAREARIALRRAAHSMRQAANAAGDGGVDDAHPVVRHLSAAADHLAAGRDLLQTHFTSGPLGERVQISYWGSIITSAPVTSALLSELAAHARQLAPWAARLSLSGDMDSGVPTPARLGMHAASRWLWVAGATIEAAQRGGAPADGHALLAAIPANVMPPHRPLTDAQSVPELCDSVARTAERLRHHALRFTQHARWSPAATSRSWRRHAMASAITGHASEVILRALADRTGQLDADPAIGAGLRAAADAMAESWTSWRAVASEWDIISTGSYRRAGRTPMAVEFTDLVLGTGRLAYGNPDWAPACTGAVLTRDPSDLAATPGDIGTVLAAVHQAADAIYRVAAEDREAVRTAADGRLFVPTRLMPDGCDIPYPYTPAPRLRSQALILSYDAAIEATAHSVTALDYVAARLAAPSQILAAARRASPPAQAHRHASPGHRRPASQAAAVTENAQLERTLRGLRITEPVLLARAAVLDEAARGLVLEATTKARRRDTARGWRSAR